MGEKRKYTEREVREAISYSHHFYGDLSNDEVCSLFPDTSNKDLISRTIKDRRRIPASLAEWIEKQMGFEFDERNKKYITRHGLNLPLRR